MRRAALAGLVAAAGACGARTGLEIPPPAPPRPECVADADCAGSDDLCNPVVCDPLSIDALRAAGMKGPGGVCKKLAPIDCDDHDPCTNESCDPGTGQCSYSLATLDLDGDGYRGPRPGTKPGDPGSCGNDCDDTNANAHPGGVEVCDGVDNDCNGVVDDNASFIPLIDQPIRISGDIAPAGPGGLAWSGTSYVAVYGGTSDGFDTYLSALGPNGDKLPPGEHLLNLKNGDNSGGPIVWIGDRYGVAWQDRRDGDYETYFALLDQNGTKADPGDVRLTFASGFSVNPALAWNGLEFTVAWQDDRDGLFNVYAQRVGVDGVPVGSNVALTSVEDGYGNESPSVAAGLNGVGVAWTQGDALTHYIGFQTYNADLSPRSPRMTLTDGSTEPVYPTIVWNKDRYVVAWFDKGSTPKAIWAEVLSEDGDIIVPAQTITNPGPFRSRYPYLRPLGDRLLLVYSDDRDQNNGYELYSRMIGSDLSLIGTEHRLTNAQRDSVYPIAAFGPSGDVGILFRDDREGGAHNIYFTRLGCVTTP